MGELLTGVNIVVMGVTNDRSIAWAIAQACQIKVHTLHLHTNMNG